jgi:redox-regulated HSP33 family molecular chaperone
VKSSPSSPDTIGLAPYVDHPQTHFPLNDQGKLDVRRAVGTDGSIQVVKDPILLMMVFVHLWHSSM